MSLPWDDAQKRYQSAAAANDIASLSDDPDERIGGSAYTVVLAPGQIRHVNVFDFFGSDIDKTVDWISNNAAAFEILWIPRVLDHPNTFRVRFDASAIDKLLDRGDWQSRLRVHHALGRAWMDLEMPTSTYVLFHQILSLDSHFAIAECLDAWVRESSTDAALANSYRSSAEHLFLCNKLQEFAVFRQTPFVLERANVVIDAEERRRESAAAAQAAAQVETLRRS